MLNFEIFDKHFSYLHFVGNVPQWEQWDSRPGRSREFHQMGPAQWKFPRPAANFLPARNSFRELFCHWISCPPSRTTSLFGLRPLNIWITNYYNSSSHSHFRLINFTLSVDIRIWWNVVGCIQKHKLDILVLEYFPKRANFSFKPLCILSVSVNAQHLRSKVRKWNLEKKPKTSGFKTNFL